MIEKIINLKESPDNVFLISSSNEENRIVAFLDADNLDFKGRLEVVHNFRKTVSRIILRIVADNGSKIDLEGVVRIEKNAKEADSNLDMKILILDKNSVIKSLPVVEVNESDVKAGHGLTISGIPRSELFYLGSRGIKISEGKKLIKEGFLEI